jgi:hypothetical protein
MSGFRAALAGIGIVWLVAVVFAYRAEFVAAPIVDTWAFPASLVLGMVPGLALSLPIGIRFMAWFASAGFLAPLLGLVIPVASTFVVSDAVTLPLEVKEKRQSPGGRNDCNAVTFQGPPLERFCVSQDTWQLLAVGDRVRVDGERNMLGLRILKWEKLGQ